jgi:DNA segregation ATPase FtsK/SpoIIIE, S-DNA-T family
MTIRLERRPARSRHPVPPLAEPPVPAPPRCDGGASGGSTVQAFLPAVGAVSAGVMIVVFRAGNPVFLMFGGLLMLAALGTGVAMLLGQRTTAVRQRRAEREDYLDYLERLRLRLRDVTRAWRDDALAQHPGPAALMDVVRDPARRWERRRRDSDFLEIRLGLGTHQIEGLALAPPADPVHPHDPFLGAQAEAVVRQCGRVFGAPVTAALDAAGHVSIVGDPDEVSALARSVVLQVAALHAPEDVAIALAYPPESAADWAGADRLPHVLAGRDDDGVPVRLVAPDPATLGEMLRGELAERVRESDVVRHTRVGARPRQRRRLLVVLDERDPTLAGAQSLLPPDVDAADIAVTVVHLLTIRAGEPDDVALRIDVDATSARLPDGRSVEVLDQVSGPWFESIARMLAGSRLTVENVDPDDLIGATGVTDLLGIGHPDDLRPAELWADRQRRDFLRVPIGRDDQGAPVLLDLKESAQLGMGPHGLCIGATGSGKSELLRTLVLSLALTHSPEDISMVLVDYKGGAAFAACNPLPHVAGIIDNLADDPQLTQRARTSIQGEVVRRQALLMQAGALPSIGHYRRARVDRPELAPMPHLLIVIDEFAELLTADPDFVDLLVTIGRIGRSIGVHLLLSSQRVELGKLKGLDTYLSYRIGLRTFSESESSLILDTKDAFHLPPTPGYAYLKVDTTVYTRLRAGFVSAPVRPIDQSADRSEQRSRPVPVLVPAYAASAATPEAITQDAPEDPDTGPTLLTACVERLAAAAPRVAPVWLRPLPVTLGVGEVLDRSEGALDPLAVPIGLVDDPARQRQQPWLLDLTRAGGHVAVIGAPQSGRTTLLRTLVVAGSLTHSPHQLGFYGLDLTGGGLSMLQGFPHVGGVAARTEPALMVRMLEELAAMVDVRERLFRDRDIDSLDTLRRRHTQGELPELASADVVLLIDGYGLLRTDFPHLEDPVTRLLQRGGGFGVHVVLGMTRWSEVRLAQQGLVGTRVELHLNDPIDSAIDRKLAATIPAGQPGRALTEERLLAQVALPVESVLVQAAGETAHLEVGDALREVGQRVSRAWPGVGTAPIRSLPFYLDPSQLPPCELAAPATTLGLRQDTMGPATVDLAGRDPHLVVLGDTATGKTTALRTLVAGLVDRLTPDELVFAVIDLRGGLAPDVPRDYLGGHAGTAVQARALAESVARELTRRTDTATPPGPTAPPRIVVLVDDVDIVTSAVHDALAPLLPFLPSARDLGLHLVLTRPVAGASRALYERTLQSVRDNGGSLLLLSGDRAEGPILPQLYAEALPPGRGRLVRRGEPPHLLQVAHAAPAYS